jgi:hypothetical protein
MNRKFRALTFSACVTALFTIKAGAGESTGEFESHSAHQHGVTTINVAIEKQQLDVSIESPAIDMLGFEHAPGSEKDRTAIQRIATLLRKGNLLFIPNSTAQCSLRSQTVAQPEWEEHDDKHIETDAEHSEYKAKYKFECKHVAALEKLEIRLDSVLLTSGKLIVNVIAGKKQHQHTLNQRSGIVPLR